MFTHSAFIRKNTPEIRQKLEGLGYTEHTSILSLGDENCVVTFPDQSEYMTVHISSVDEEMLEETKDCSDNEELFFAIAALRDDSDKHQWFRNIFKGGVWYNDRHQCVGPVCYQKMSADELINHFNNK